MERLLHGRRGLAAFMMTLLLILLFVLPLALLALTFADTVTPAVSWVRDTFAKGPPPPPAWVHGIPLVGDSIDAWWRELVASRAKLAELLGRLTQPVQQILLKTVLILGEGVMQLSFTAFIGFFFYRDGKALIGAARALTNRVAGRLTPELFRVVGGTIQGVVYGLIGTAVAQGVVAVIGFLIAGVPGALLLGFLTFTLSIVPVGPPLVWGGAAAWLAYAGSPGWAIFMALYGFFVISGIDNVIKPLLISRGSSLPFVLVFLGAFGGVIAFGFIGIFLGPTLLAIAFGLAGYGTRRVELEHP
jgi:predicted PurR-regulated permease PerM